MPDDLLQRFDALRHDVDAAPLPGPAALRRVGTRRRRIRTAMVVTVAAVSVAATGAGVSAAVRNGTSAPFPPAGGVTSKPAPPARPDTEASIGLGGATTSSAPPPATTGTPTVKPAQLDFTVEPDPADACAIDPSRCVPPGVGDGAIRLPAACALTTNDSNSSIVKRESVKRSARRPSDPTTVPNMYTRTLTRYKGSGATTYLAEVAAAVSACPSVQRSAGVGVEPWTYRHSVLRTDFIGDQSLLIASKVMMLKTPESTTRDTEVTFRIAVVRFGSQVAVVYDHGWEGTMTADDNLWNAFIDDAVKALRDGKP